MKILEGRRMAAVFAAYIGIFSAYVLLPDIRRFVVIIGIFTFCLFAVNLWLRTRGQKFSVRAEHRVLIAFGRIPHAEAVVVGAGHIRSISVGDTEMIAVTEIVPVVSGEIPESAAILVILISAGIQGMNAS